MTPDQEMVEMFKRMFGAQPATENNGRLTADELERLLDRINRDNEGRNVLRQPTDRPPPRIVCTRCPRVVDVHYAEQGVFGHAENIWFVWVECHGKHLIGSLPSGINNYGGGAKRSDYVIEDITAWDIMTVNNHYTNAERQVVEYAERAKLLKSYMDKAGF